MSKKPEEAVNQQVAKTVITYTMVHPVLLDPAKMNPNDVAYHLTDGEFVGARTSIHTTPLADDQVDQALNDVGGTQGWFKIEDTSALRGS